MSKTNDGGFAFPQLTKLIRADGQITAGEGNPGMSLRAYFAGQALTGYIAAFAGDGITLPDSDIAADRALEYADALIAAMDRPTPKDSQP